MGAARRSESAKGPSRSRSSTGRRCASSVRAAMRIGSTQGAQPPLRPGANVLSVPPSRRHARLEKSLALRFDQADALFASRACL